MATSGVNTTTNNFATKKLHGTSFSKKDLSNKFSVHHQNSQQIQDHKKAIFYGIYTETARAVPICQTINMIVQYEKKTFKGTEGIPILPQYVGGNGFWITCPGVYFLPCDIVFNPYTTNQSAIVIDADDVVLDLNGHTLSQGNTNTLTFGVLINGHKNVIIKNGTIKKFTQNGIRLNANSSIIWLDQIIGYNNGNIAGGQSTGAVSGTTSQDIKITNSTFTQNVGAGVVLGGITKLYVDNSHFDDNTGATNVVFSPSPSSPLLPGTISSGLAVVFLPNVPDFATSSKNVVVTNSTFSGHQATFFTFGLGTINLGVTGVTAASNIKSLYVENCVAQNNTALNQPGIADTAFAAEGMTFLVSDAVIKNCQISNITNTSTFPLSHVDGITIDGTNIVAENINVSEITGSVATGSYGFYALNVNKFVVYKNCRALTVTNLAPFNDVSLGFAFGFSSVQTGLIGPAQPGLGIVFDQCVAENCVAAGNALGLPVGGGLSLQTQTNATVKDCIFNANSNGIFLIDFPGFDLFASSNSIIENNILQFNAFAGILDATNANNAYIKNYARTNGFGIFYNYIGVPAGTPIRDWALPGPPSAVDNFGILDPLDNISISP
jgi:parallel beta-helix repeat protein